MEIVTKFLSLILKVLPTSPFTDVLDSMDKLPYLGYINYFIPVGKMLDIGAVWLVSIGVFYLYSIILRWIRAID